MKRRVGLVGAILLIGAVELAGAQAGPQASRASVVEGVLTLSVTDELNPLASAIEQLQRVCLCAISLEEPEWQHAEDVQGRFDAQAKRTIRTGPRASVALSRSVASPMSRQDVAAVLRDLVGQIEQQTSARFAVVEGRTLGVVVKSVRKANGVVAPAESVLDSRITLIRDRRPLSDWLSRIGYELRRVSQRPVYSVYPPGGQLRDYMVVLAADNEPARDVLERLLSDLPREAAWRWSYSPATDRFTLGLRFGAPFAK